ncbi:MAG: AAA family ATPase, partial [Litorilinea sp.]
TALGGAMQNVVTETWAATQAAIEWLKTNRHGRATFLPLDRLNVLPEIRAPRHPGILGNGCDLVEYDPAIADAVEQLLNRVWVAENLPAARHALDQIRGGPRPTVVTLEGEIIRPGGAVTGGSDRDRRDDSILARARELRELPAQLEKAGATTAQLAQACNQLAQEIEQAAARVQPIQDRLDQLGKTEIAARNQLEATRRDLDRARQASQWRAGRAAELETERTDLVEQRTALAAKFSELDNAIAQVQTELSQRETASEQAGADSLLQQMAEVRAASAEANTTLQSKQSLLDNQARNREAVQTQLEAKDAQIVALQREATELEAQVRVLDGKEQELNRAIAALQVELNPAEVQLRTWETEQATLEQQERAQQETLRRTESGYNTAQLQHQRTDDRLEQLQRQIEQDIGLVTLETADDLAYQPPLPWEAVVKNLPTVDELGETVETEVQELRARLGRVSNVNPDAPREYAEAAERHAHLLTQSDDLEAAISDLRKVIRELDEVMETELSKTFGAVSEQFVHFFQSLFSGGSARLVLADPSDITNSGIEIIARPPGKRPQSLALLSGGERTLTALALIFAILRVSPTPFCVLDEVDAALDEANVDRFRATLSDLDEGTQFIVITHNRRTLEGTNAIYGITMASDGTSRVISLRMDGTRIVRAAEGADDGESPADQGRTRDPGPDADNGGLDEIEELVKM